MRWSWLKQFPKFVLVVLLIGGSTAAFLIWRATYRIRHVQNTSIRPPPTDDRRPNMPKVEVNHARMILIDNDLYDVETGELIYRNWLKDGMPTKLFWESESKSLLAEYERGFVRYGLDGKEVASLRLNHPFGMADDRKWIVYSKDRDIWRATVNWKDLRLENERKLTSLGQFNDQNFVGSIILGTDRTLVVRSKNQILRVNLETGDVHPTKLPLVAIGKRRSPDSKYVVGLQNGQFYCYEVDSDDAKSIPVGRGAINDYQWLDNDRCAAIAGGTKVILYDRKRNALAELLGLPLQCQKIGEPSPGGRFVFCYNSKAGALVDLEKKTATPIKGGAGIKWVGNDTFAVSRELPDSDLRGTWLQKVGESEKRVSPVPYAVSPHGNGMILSFPKGGPIVFATNQELFRMKSDGNELASGIKLSHAPEQALGLQDLP